MPLLPAWVGLRSTSAIAASRFCAAASAWAPPPSALRLTPTAASAMGQKSLDSFFKKPAAAAKAMRSSAAANEAAAAEPAPAEQPAAGAAAAAGGSDGDGAAAAATAAPADVHAAQAAEQQQLRVHANRNGALAKQVTCGCAAAGQLPALPRLH